MSSHDHCPLLVVGAGPYGLATAARARERGIETVVVGKPLGFWIDHMPAGMYLRSGFDWHLDAAGIYTFDAFAESRNLRPADVDPIPIDLFIEYATWFQTQKQLTVREQMVSALEHRDGRFVASLEDGSRITAERVVAAPGNGYFALLPPWAAAVPEGLGVHTSEFVRFGDAAGQRVVIIGGRQSAYEWAALLGEHGAARIDIVHRHDVPRFEHVSWSFVDAYVEATIKVPGWWRSLTGAERDAISRRFWEVGRLTLEWWLPPRLTGDRFHRWPDTQVVEAVSEDGAVVVTLSNGERITADRVVYATGYRVDVANVPYLSPLRSEIAVLDGFPVLDDHFQSSVPGLFVPGFAATRDFGPFFGFTKGCPAAAALIVDALGAG